MNEYFNVIQAFTKIAFYYANNLHLLQNLEKWISRYKKIQSTHIPFTWGHLGTVLWRSVSELRPPLGKARFSWPYSDRGEKSSLGVVGFIVESAPVLLSILEWATFGGWSE